MLKLQPRSSINFSAAVTGARLADLLFRLLFAVYVAGALCWLLLGIVSTGGVIWGGFYTALTQLLTHLERTSLWSRLIRSILYSIRFTHPSVGLIFYYLFSLTNIVAALAMVKIRQRDWVVRALAVGMIGTAAVFNLPAHLALDLALPAIQPLHDYYHVVSGLAYALGLLFFPTGGLPPIPLPRWAPWPELGAALQSVYALLVLAFGFSVAGITDGEPMGLVLFFGIAIPLIGITAQALRYAQATDDTPHSPRTRGVRLLRRPHGGLPPIDRTRARGVSPHRPGSQQQRDRPAPHPQPENRAQPCLQHL